MSVKQNRSASVNILLTPDELKAWRTKATLSGISLSQMVRDAVNKVEIKSKVDKNAIANLQYKVNRIGNNLNQLARWANTHKSEGEAKAVEEQLEAIAQFCEDIVKNNAG